MMGFLTENYGTIVVFLIVAGIVAAIVRKMVRDKRKGKSVLCDCGCESCGEKSACGMK
jgi:hypothetical protein